MDRDACFVVEVVQRPRAVLEVFVAPLHQGHDHREQAAAHVGEHVFVAGAAAVLAVGALIGAGIGLAMPVMLTQATAHLPGAQAASGSAVVNTSRQLGYVLGVAILIAILSAADSAHHPARAFGQVWWFIAITAAVSAVTAWGITSRRQR